jgi:hypothetical protein
MEYLAINGVVYLLFDYAVMEPTSIAPFDLNSEKWMPTLQGPQPLWSAKFGLTFTFGQTLSLANLNGTFVIVNMMLMSLSTYGF